MNRRMKLLLGALLFAIVASVAAIETQDFGDAVCIALGLCPPDPFAIALGCTCNLPGGPGA